MQQSIVPTGIGPQHHQPRDPLKVRVPQGLRRTGLRTLGDRRHVMTFDYNIFLPFILKSINEPKSPHKFLLLACDFHSKCGSASGIFRCEVIRCRLPCHLNVSLACRALTLNLFCYNLQCRCSIVCLNLLISLNWKCAH